MVQFLIRIKQKRSHSVVLDRKGSADDFLFFLIAQESSSSSLGFRGLYLFETPVMKKEF